LRNYNTHWRIAQANWTISHGLEKDSRSVRFIVTKDELLAWSGWNAEARKYISHCTQSVDIYELFSSYREHVQSFYAWHRGAVLAEYNEVLCPYLKYKRLYEGISTKINWNMIISHLPLTLNPLQYLSQYLPPNAVEHVLSLPHRSKEQADAAIRLADMEDFCDDTLREKVYLLFGVAR
jgi:hypothetical protein